jgi:RNA polymerase sigma-32 factor
MTGTLPATLNLHPERGLSAYFRTINAFPLLNATDERALAVRFRRDHDLEAARQLILSNLRFVVRIARGFNGYGLAQADLIQEGNIGLMKAVKHYDPQRGVRLMSFAVHWIRAEIYEFVLRNWRIVKVATTKAQRKLFFNLRKTRARLGWMTRGEIDQLAENLDVSPETVQEMESRMSSPDVPYDIGDDHDEDNVRVAPAGYLQDLRYNPETLYSEAHQESTRQAQLDEAMSALDARSRDIVKSRWLDQEKTTLHVLAEKYGISAERVRQIENKALEAMKDRLLA